MEIDTEASRSCIPESLYKKCLKNVDLMEDNIKLKGYSEETIPNLGVIALKLKYKNFEKSDAQFVIVKDNNVPLFGRD